MDKLFQFLSAISSSGEEPKPLDEPNRKPAPKMIQFLFLLF
jgi:hypothetical protein